MKRLLAILVIFSAIHCCHAQIGSELEELPEVQLLSAYNFEEGGYSILISPSESPWNRDDSISYYTDDIAVLKDIQKLLTYSEKPDIYRYGCWEDRYLYVCKNGQMQEMIAFSANCRAVYSRMGSFKTTGLEFALPLVAMNKLTELHTTFDDINKARLFRDSILHDSNLIMAYDPDWLMHEGIFSFHYDSKESEETVKAFLEKQMHKKYPKEDFELSVRLAYGSSDTKWTYFVLVICNFSLYKKFNLYKPTWLGWEYYPLTLRTFWR